MPTIQLPPEARTWLRRLGDSWFVIHSLAMEHWPPSLVSCTSKTIQTCCLIRRLDLASSLCAVWAKSRHSRVWDHCTNCSLGQIHISGGPSQPALSAVLCSFEFSFAFLSFSISNELGVDTIHKQSPYGERFVNSLNVEPPHVRLKNKAEYSQLDNTMIFYSIKIIHLEAKQTIIHLLFGRIQISHFYWIIEKQFSLSFYPPVPAGVTNWSEWFAIFLSFFHSSPY